MRLFNPQTFKSPLFYASLLNSFLLPIGMLFFGWTLFQTLFLYWLEPLAALILLIYLELVIPKKYAAASNATNAAQQKKRLQIIGLSIYTACLSFATLLLIIHISNVPDWDISQGIGDTLSQLPRQLWQNDLLLLSVLFLGMFLVPILLLEKRGFIPIASQLPTSSRLLIQPLQFIFNFLWLGIIGVFYYTGLINPLSLLCILTLFKLLSDAGLYLYLER